MTLWSDFFKLFTYANEKDPLTKTKDASKFSGAGISQADALQTGGELVAGQGPSNYVNLRQTYDMIDTTTLGNRSMRYKEYERLRNLPEIEMAMTVFADEACVAGDTKIATPFGFQTIESLVKDKSDERFLVYCYDLEKSDYTLGWAYAPRLVRKAKTVKIVLDNGKTITATHDHRVLKRNGEWTTCGELRFGDELMPFYRIPANQNHNDLKSNLFPRLYSFEKGWVHERQFIDDWKNGKTSPEYEKVNRAARLICGDISVRQIAKIMDHDWNTVENWMHKNGFTLKELRHLAKNKTVRKVVGVSDGPETEVYDISVEKHKCFATDSVILHNCQKNDDGNVLKIDCRNDDIRKELEFLLLNRKMLNINRYAYVYFKDLIVHGDKFFEVVINPDNPSEGIYKLVPLPVDTMYRIETIKGRLVEFQQSKEGPDYQSIARGDVSQMSDAELAQSTAIRFAPTQVLHIRIGDDRKNFYPYGQSLIEPARGPAHQLRLMEDAMVVYRLVRAPERRVFYIDVGQLPPFKAEAFIERLKDQFRKRKTANNRGSVGANMVEERWQPPAQDEDFWIPTRPNANSRIETLPGAQNLGEIDDALYFRNKLFIALNFPKNYFSSEDVNATRITLSAQDVKFARMIERLQSNFEDAMIDLCERHLELRGYPQEMYHDLKVKMTPPSDWRELSRAEVRTARFTNAGALKGGMLMSDYDIYTRILMYSDEDTSMMLSRLKLQKLEDLKIQIMSQNPQLLGVGIPNQQSPDTEVGAEAGGPTPELAAGGAPPEGAPPEEAPEGAPPGASPEDTDEKSKPGDSASEVPIPSEDDIKKYNMEIKDYRTDMDYEDKDTSYLS
jgi:hypothetical protein